MVTVRATDMLGSPFAAHARRPVRRSPEPEPAPVPALAPAPDPILAPTQEWPLRSYRELRGMPVSVRSARLHARKVLYKWHIGVITDTVELLVSEITTNAVRASAGSAGPAPWVGLWLTSDGRSVLIQVWDGNRREPLCRDAGPDAEGGRGLQLVEALSAQWGCYAAARPGGDGPGGDGPGGNGLGGKIVWALVHGVDASA